MCTSTQPVPQLDSIQLKANESNQSFAPKIQCGCSQRLDPQFESTSHRRPEAPDPQTLPGANADLGPKGLPQYVRTPIDDGSVAHKLRCGFDHSPEVQYLLDAVQITIQKLVDCGQQSQARISGVDSGLIGCHGGTDDPVRLGVFIGRANVHRCSQCLGNRAIYGLLVELHAYGIVGPWKMDGRCARIVKARKDCSAAVRNTSRTTAAAAAAFSAHQ
mmetsp:Transcript_4976/g.11059  ORF Transcript_4976/g.11059 Transcript_4976/m.11059 type:complete len:217 (-) Transcript_4976:288-938(-)